MPEITQAELQMFTRYQILGSPAEVEKKIRDLETDNQKEREKVREMSDKLPKQDEVVVKKEKADLLPMYEELGVPKDLKKKLEEGQKAQADLATANQEKAALAFAKVVGLAEESVAPLVALPALQGAKFEVKKGKVKDRNGVEKDGEIGFVTLAGENQKALDFVQLLEQVPAVKGLRMVEAGSSRRSVDFVQQGATTGAAGESVYDRIRDSRKKEAKQATENQPKNPANVVNERLGMLSR